MPRVSLVALVLFATSTASAASVEVPEQHWLLVVTHTEGGWRIDKRVVVDAPRPRPRSGKPKTGPFRFAMLDADGAELFASHRADPFVVRGEFAGGGPGDVEHPIEHVRVPAPTVSFTVRLPILRQARRLAFARVAPDRKTGHRMQGLGSVSLPDEP